MITQFEIPEILNFYSSNDNYEMYDLNRDSNTCYIYFSSNGIYYPNTKEAFENSIVESNRFDWKRNIVRSSNRVLFVRDVLKTWYLKGINSNISSIEKLLELLQKETRGLKVTCVGSSAGGYAATLFACLLNAERAFNFSGQFSLWHGLNDEDKRLEMPFLTSHIENKSINKFFSLRSYLENSNVPIFYFYPAHCPLDYPQMETVCDLDMVYRFPFNSAEHAKTCYPINFLDLFSKSNLELISLSLKISNHPVGQFPFSFKVSGIPKTLMYSLHRQLKFKT